MFLIHIFLKKGKDNVDKTNPVVGTMELMKGFGNPATKKNKTIVI